VVEVRPISQVAMAPVPLLSVASNLRVPLLLFDSVGRQFSTGRDVFIDFAVSVDASGEAVHGCVVRPWVHLGLHGSA
jgi:hypothetical protein